MRLHGYNSSTSNVKGDESYSASTSDHDTTSNGFKVAVAAMGLTTTASTLEHCIYQVSNLLNDNRILHHALYSNGVMGEDPSEHHRITLGSYLSSACSNFDHIFCRSNSNHNQARVPDNASAHYALISAPEQGACSHMSSASLASIGAYNEGAKSSDSTETRIEEVGSLIPATVLFEPLICHIITPTIGARLNISPFYPAEKSIR